MCLSSHLRIHFSHSFHEALLSGNILISTISLDYIAIEKPLKEKWQMNPMIQETLNEKHKKTFLFPFTFLQITALNWLRKETRAVSWERKGKECCVDIMLGPIGKRISTLISQLISIILIEIRIQELYCRLAKIFILALLYPFFPRNPSVYSLSLPFERDGKTLDGCLKGEIKGKGRREKERDTFHIPLTQSYQH